MPNQVTAEQIREAVEQAEEDAKACAFEFGIELGPKDIVLLGVLEAIADRAEDVAALVNKVP